MTSIAYLDPALVVDKKQTDVPLHRGCRSGYGSKLATSWMLRLTDKRWRRVYVVCYSNCGSAYLNMKGGPVYLGSYQP